jgi:hypothetical protein
MRIIAFVVLLSSCSISENSNNDLQVMLSDRPEMKCSGYDSLLNMAKEKGARWCPDPHSVVGGADFKRGIQLREGMTPEESWSVLFFESYNLSSEKEFMRIYREGVDGKHDRNSWVRENTRIEYNNSQKFLKFATDTLRPFFVRHSLETSELDKMISDFQLPFETWMSSSQNSYPWNYWGTYYDNYLK